MGGPDDVDAAVVAAKAAFETYSQTTREEVFGPVLTMIGYDDDEDVGHGDHGVNLGAFRL